MRKLLSVQRSNLRCLPIILAVLLIIVGQYPCNVLAQSPTKVRKGKDVSGGQEKKQELKIATFGGGCFWCVEAVFENLKGVKSVVSGYSGGRVPNPTYEQVCTKLTGHVEVCQIHYDPMQVTFDELLEVFWKTHDPTTKDLQGADEGPQYRSVVFFHDDEQKTVAEKYMKKLDESGAFPAKIVTVIGPLINFYEAEGYHQDYFRKNPYAGYCMAVVRPKVEKFKKVFKDKVSPPAK